MISKILAVIILLSSTFTTAQNLVTGRVIDSETKKFIKEASIKIANTSEEAKTNPYGYFQLTVDSTMLLIVSAEGYEAAELNAPRTNTFIVPLFRETMPGYRGGMQEFYKFLAETIRYPLGARKVGKEGRTYVLFEVDSTLGAQNLIAIKDPGDYFGKEVIRAIKLAPKLWIPKTKSVALIMPVTFQLGGPSGVFNKLPAPGSDIQLPPGKLLNEVVITIFGSNPK